VAVIYMQHESPAAASTAQPTSSQGAQPASGRASATAASGARHAGRARQAARPANAPVRYQYVFVPQVVTQTVTRFVEHLPAALLAALAIALTLAAIAGTAAFVFGRRARRQAREAAAATAAALTDPLTGALNRRGFTEAVERELARSRRYDRPFVLAYADVRGLKAVNDSEGHLAGDELIKGVASMIAESARAHDVVGRLGGDEFALLLPEQRECDAKTVTDRIRERIEARRAALGFGPRWDLTIGTAAFPYDGKTPEELLAVADRRLYEQRGIELGRPTRRRARPRSRVAGGRPVATSRS
jgi:diguanylate cyclase (GGDEF)-like protein